MKDKGDRMTRDDAMNKLKDILENDFRIPKDKITEEATFRGNLGMDSLDAVDLIYLMKKTFGLAGDVHAFRELHTVKNVVDHIVREAGSAAPQKTE